MAASGPSYSARRFTIGELEQIARGDRPLIEESYPIPVGRLIAIIVLDALKKGAAAITIEPCEKRLVVKYATDSAPGHEGMLAPDRLRTTIGELLKRLASIEPMGTRGVYAGVFEIESKDGGVIEIRVSTHPVLWGEKIELRIFQRPRVWS